MKNQIDDMSVITALLFFLTTVLVFFGMYPIVTSKEGILIGAVYVCFSIIFGIISAIFVLDWLKNTNEDRSVIENNEPLNIERWDFPKFWIGMSIAILGAVVMFTTLMISGISTGNSVVLALGSGIYFMGCNVVVQSRFSQKRDFQNLSKQIAGLKKTLAEQKMKSYSRFKKKGCDL